MSFIDLLSLDLAVSAGPEDDVVSWLCDDCIGHRQRYPTTNPDYLIEKRIGGGGMKLGASRPYGKGRSESIRIRASERIRLQAGPNNGWPRLQPRSTTPSKPVIDRSIKVLPGFVG